MENKIETAKSVLDLLESSGGKILVYSFVAVIAIGILNKILLPLFSIEFTVKGIHFGGDFWKNSKKKEQPEPAFNIRDIKNTLLAFSYDIINDAQIHYQELTATTKNRLSDFIKAIQDGYETVLQDDYKGPDRELLLEQDSMKYLKNLMELASFDKDVIIRITNGIKDLVNLEDSNASETEKSNKRESIVLEIKSIYKNIFVGREDPCKSLIDTRTINTIIEEQAKLKVNDIILKLIPEFQVKDKSFKVDLNNSITAFLARVEEEQNVK